MSIKYDCMAEGLILNLW